MPRDFQPTEYEFEFEKHNEQQTMSCREAEMSFKKLHEVALFSQVVVSIAYVLYHLQAFTFFKTLFWNRKDAGITKIIDIGAGQGYLTHRLAEHFPCTALDNSEVQAAGSKARGARLDKKKKGRLESKTKQPAPEQVVEPVVKEIDTASSNHANEISYKVIQVDANSLTSVVREESSAGFDRIMLVGLHACGDLSAVTILTTFIQEESVKAVAVVPCCYNLLTEDNHRSETATKGMILLFFSTHFIKRAKQPYYNN